MVTSLELLLRYRKIWSYFKLFSSWTEDEEAHRPIVAEGRQGIIDISIDCKVCLHVLASGLVEGQNYG